MSKQMNEENFPVATLVSRKLRPIVEAYYAAARFADDIADNPQLGSAEKLARLEQCERDFYAGLQGQEIRYSEAYNLGKIFGKENLDASLYTDLLRAFAKDAQGAPIEIWEQLIDYCRYSAAPVGRFILALYNESPSAYLPAETLCAVLQISNHLQDLRKDMQELKRCYLPCDLMVQYDVRESDIYLDKSLPQLKALVADISKRLRQMLDDAAILPALVSNWRLKMQIGVILSLTNSVLQKLEKYDILAYPVRLSKTDWLKAVISGSCKGLFCKSRKVGKIL